MTTGVRCPTCENGISPHKGEPCRGCQEKDMSRVARAISRAIQGPPIRIHELQDKEPGQ
jgi:hypothetical protein